MVLLFFLFRGEGKQFLALLHILKDKVSDAYITACHCHGHCQ